jgi:hypothetical protein
MTVRVKKSHPALKHGGYSATALLPGEDPAAFETLYQDLIAELRPDGPLESGAVATIARLTWRKQNLETFRIAESAGNRNSAIYSAKVPAPPDPFASFGPHWEPADPAEYRAAVEAAQAQARKELGSRYIFVEMGQEVTVSKMFDDLEVEERLDSLIDKQLKRLLFLKGLTSLPSMAPSTSMPRIEGPKKAA